MLCIIDCGSSYVKNIQEMTSDFGFDNVTITSDKIAKTDFFKYTHVIISGNPTLLTEIDTAKHLKLFLNDKRKKIYPGNTDLCHIGDYLNFTLSNSDK